MANSTKKRNFPQKTMPSPYPLLFLWLVVVGCQQILEQKITQTESYQEIAQNLDWQQVDAYPKFANCPEDAPLEAQKICFQSQLAHLFSPLQLDTLRVFGSPQDTLSLPITITNSGSFILETQTLDTLQIPKILLDYLQKHLDSLPKIQPALKRGIPVTTVFPLPIALKTHNP